MKNESKIKTLECNFKHHFKVNLDQIIIVSNYKAIIELRRLAVLWIFQNTMNTTQNIANNYNVKNEMLIRDVEAARYWMKIKRDFKRKYELLN